MRRVLGLSLVAVDGVSVSGGEGRGETKPGTSCIGRPAVITKVQGRSCGRTSPGSRHPLGSRCRAFRSEVTIPYCIPQLYGYVAR